MDGGCGHGFCRDFCKRSFWRYRLQYLQRSIGGTSFSVLCLSGSDVRRQRLCVAWVDARRGGCTCRRVQLCHASGSDSFGHRRRFCSSGHKWCVYIRMGCLSRADSRQLRRNLGAVHSYRCGGVAADTCGLVAHHV